MKTGNLDGQRIAELQNYKFQMLSSAPNSSEALFYYDTTLHSFRYYNGTEWIDGTKYVEGNGIDITNNTVSINIASGANAGNITLTATVNGLAASVAEASTTTKGIIEIATDTEATTGTSTTLAVNPKQLATKVTKLSTKPTAGTYTKVTINGEGQVTAGANLQASDIPNLTLSKITDVTATASEVMF